MRKAVCTPERFVSISLFAFGSFVFSGTRFVIVNDMIRSVTVLAPASAPEQCVVRVSRNGVNE